MNPHLAAFTACFFWGISFIATKTALPVVPPLTIVTLRLLISSLCFAIWIWLRRDRPRWEGWRWLGLMLTLSLFNASLHYGLQTYGMQFTTAANASLYSITGPLVILVISVLFLGEHLTLRKTLGTLVALIGVLTVMGWETVAAFDLTSHLFGDLLVFASIAMWGVFTVISKRQTLRMSALQITAVTTWLGTLQMLPVGWWESQRAGFSLAQITPLAWGAVAFLGITCSFLATLLYVQALTRLESQRVGVYLYTIPPLTYLAAALFLNETITTNLLIGSCAVGFGVWLTESR